MFLIKINQKILINNKYKKKIMIYDKNNRYDFM